MHNPPPPAVNGLLIIFFARRHTSSLPWRLVFSLHEGSFPRLNSPLPARNKIRCVERTQHEHVSRSYETVGMFRILFDTVQNSNIDGSRPARGHGRSRFVTSLWVGSRSSLRRAGGLHSFVNASNDMDGRAAGIDPSQGQRPLPGSSCIAATGARSVPCWQPGDWAIHLSDRLHRAPSAPSPYWVLFGPSSQSHD